MREILSRRNNAFVIEFTFQTVRQIFIFLLATIQLFVVYGLSAQTRPLLLTGTVLNEAQAPIPGVALRVLNNTNGSITNSSGEYSIIFEKPGRYWIEISSVGYETKQVEIQISATASSSRDFQLQESAMELGEVVVEAESDKKTIESGSLSVEAVELASIRSESSDLAAVLNRTAGVNIRQSAGVGSEARVNLNGLQGKAVTFFRDGVPTDYLGDGFNIALLPANSLERVEVYKGVLPITLGSDALGGALNFVTKKERESNISFSHEVASFNTHRSSLNAYAEGDNNRFINLLGFFNFSENNYPVDVQIRNPETRNLENIRAKRFHDTFLSAFAEVQVGARQKRWADEFIVSGGFSLLRDEVQHSLQMRQAYGRAEFAQDGLFGSVKYEKALNSRFDVSLFGAFGQHTTLTIDTALQVFNWLGEVERMQGFTRGEINNGNISRAEFTVTEWAGRATAKYRLTEKQSLTFNNVFTRKRRVGEDPVGPRVTQDEIDPLTVPASLATNISGLEWKSLWLDNRLTYTVGIKNYYFRNSGIDFGDVFVSNFDPIVNTSNLLGASTSFKYVFNDEWLLRGSYEYATRIPEEDEIYGDGLFLQSNPELEPERSHNVNVGVRLDKQFSDFRSGYLEFNTFIRQQRSLIFTRASAFSVVNENGAEANSIGAEIDLSYDVTRRLNFIANATFQDIRLAAASEFGQEFLVGERIPDIPYFFFNTGLKYNSKEYWNYVSFTGFIYQSFVEDYFLFFRASPTVEPPTIPQRNIVRVGITTRIKNWTITTESNNIFNAKIFENFREQRPGRTWHIKVSHQLQR